MRLRKQPIGNSNIIGTRVCEARHKINMKQKELTEQLQLKGIDITNSALSKLEGQVRSVNDYEILALSEILGVSFDWLLAPRKNNK